MRVLHVGVNKCNDVWAEGQGQGRDEPGFFSGFFSIVFGFSWLCHFWPFRRVHAASKMRRLRICNSQQFSTVCHFDSATANIFPQSQIYYLILWDGTDATGRKIKSNKRRQPQWKAHKMLQEIHFKYLANQKARIEAPTTNPSDFRPFRSSNNALACISFEFTTVFAI